jgi:uncharacterized protein Usg
MGQKEHERTSINLSILGFKEGHEWCALALELDLRGYGRTLDEAMADLKEHVSMQVSFCLQMGTLDSMFFPAEDQFWKMYHKGKLDQMISLVSHHKITRDQPVARDLPFPDNLITHGPGPRFEPCHA